MSRYESRMQKPREAHIIKNASFIKTPTVNSTFEAIEKVIKVNRDGIGSNTFFVRFKSAHKQLTRH